jgi:DNA replication protein DnaC
MTETRQQTKNGAWADCPQCQGEGYIIRGEDSKPCRCRFEVYAYNRVGPRFWPYDLATYKPATPSQAKAIEIIRAAPKGSFYLHGNNRTGKTSLAAALFRARVYAVGRLCSWWEEGELFSIANQAPSFGFLILHGIDNGIRGVWIDDVGKASLTAARRQFFFSLINAVYTQAGACQIVVTSNYSLRDLAELAPGGEIAYGTGVASRLAEICTVIRLEEPMPLKAGGE